MLFAMFSGVFAQQKKKAELTPEPTTCGANATCWADVDPRPNVTNIQQVGTITCSATSVNPSCTAGNGYVSCNGIVQQCNG